MAFFKSPITHFVGIVLCMFGMMLFSSFTTEKTMKENLSAYADYQFSRKVDENNHKKGGIFDQLAEIKTIVLQSQNDQRTFFDATYKDMIVDINKYYDWCNPKESYRLDPSFDKKMSNYWKALPNSYKDDITTYRYNFAFKYISEHCK